MPGNDFVPLVSNLRFANVQPRTPSAGTFAACARVNTSKCYSVSVDGRAVAPWGDPLPPQTFGCKTSATTQFGDVLRFPWGVCLPLDAPVNLRPDYPNWGATTGPFASLAACRAACVVPGPR